VKDYLTDLVEFTSAINDDKLCIVTKTAALVSVQFVHLINIAFECSMKMFVSCCERSFISRKTKRRKADKSWGFWLS
jgi:hypothetical protein